MFWIYRSVDAISLASRRTKCGEVFDAIKTNDNFTSIETTNAELTGKLVRRLHLDRLLWLPEKGVFNNKKKKT